MTVDDDPTQRSTIQSARHGESTYVDYSHAPTLVSTKATIDGDDVDLLAAFSSPFGERLRLRARRRLDLLLRQRAIARAERRRTPLVRAPCFQLKLYAMFATDQVAVERGLPR